MELQEIYFDLKVIPGSETITIDGIPFSDVSYIVVFVDNANLLETAPFTGSFVVLKELKESCLTEGQYLIFTDVSGIADDGGWDYVSVGHNGQQIEWNISRDDALITYCFNETQYVKSVNELVSKINKPGNRTRLEPQWVIYPE